MSGQYRLHEVRGAALLLTFLLTLLLAGLAAAVAVFAQNSLIGARGQLLDKQAFYIAEAGVHWARQWVAEDVTRADGARVGPPTTPPLGAGEFFVTLVDHGDSTMTITAEGYVPRETDFLASRQVIEARIPFTGGGGGPNLAPSARAFASTQTPQHSAAHGNDEDLASWWQSRPGDDTGAWLALDFGSATALDEVVIQERQEHIEELTLQSSTNGLTWSTIGVLQEGDAVVSGNTRTWTFTFAQVTVQFFRVVISQVTGRGMIREFEAYAPGGGGSATLGNGGFSTQW